MTPDALNSCVPSGGPLNTSMELFQTSSADGTSYAVPTDGVVTSWSFQGSGVQDSQVTLRVYRSLAPGTDRFVPVGDGGPVTLHSGDQEFVTPARITVKAGDVIGLRSERFGTTPGGTCAATGGSADTYRFLAGAVATDIGATASYSESRGLRIDVSATVEPDADGDGYGDESQDACPRLASTQAPCPIPNTRIIRKPASRTHHRIARFTFTSNVAGATFQCRLDHHAAHRCTSPVTIKVKPGRHTFTVRARANSAVDPSPAQSRWRVRAR
jgi:hypothetical protein